MKTEYPSRVDTWLAVILIGVPLVVIGFGAFTLTRSVSAGIITIITGVFIGGVIAAFSIPSAYTLTDENLKIKSGMLEDEVPLQSIRGVEKTSSCWSAPALSLQRVKLTLDSGCRLISPKDRDAFIPDLNARLEHEKKSH